MMYLGQVALTFENSEVPDHQAAVIVRPDNDWQITCTCGALWTTASQHEITRTFYAHLRYFNRPKMETL